MKTSRIVLWAIPVVLATLLFLDRAPERKVNAMNLNPLTAEEKRVILDEGTERPFTGALHDLKSDGVYICKQCDRPLFESESKFDSGTGWPSFDDFIPGSISEVPDGSRTEIECSNCGGHIGHVFRGERFTPKSTRHCANSIALNFVEEKNEEKAIFAGGCFWGVEHHLEAMEGVLSVTSGYIGGRTENPSYREVSYKDTGHVEAVEVLYDASKVDYVTIARMFFEIHDPTQVNRQGPDIGDQYRSAVFYRDDEQREMAEKLVGLLESNGLKIATRIEPAGAFWPAEDYHQDYYAKSGKEPYCHSWTRRF